MGILAHLSVICFLWATRYWEMAIGVLSVQFGQGNSVAIPQFLFSKQQEFPPGQWPANPSLSCQNILENIVLIMDFTDMKHLSLYIYIYISWKFLQEHTANTVKTAFSGFLKPNLNVSSNREKLKGRLQRGSFDKRVRIDLPAPLSVIGTRTPLRKLPAVKLPLSFCPIQNLASSLEIW